MNWKKIRQFIGVQKITQLSEVLEIGYDSLQKSIKGGRVLSPQHRLKMLKFLVSKFKSADAAISWLEDEANFFCVVPQQEKEEKHFIQTLFSHQKILARLQTPGYYVARLTGEKAVSSILSSGSKYQGIIVTGIGGSGKTTMVKAAVRQVLFDAHLNLFYDDILWLDCENKGYEEILLALADECGIDRQQAFRNVEFATRRALQNKAVVLVLDGIDELEYIRPVLKLVNNKSKLVVSSRNIPGKAFLSELSFAHHKFRSGLSFAEIELLVKNITGVSVGKEDLTAMQRLDKKIGGLPLAWVLLASLAAETKESWGSIRKRFRLQILTSGIDSTKHNSVQASFQVSYDALHAKHKTAAALFTLLGLFNSSTILAALPAIMYADLDNDTFENDLSILVRYGLVEVYKRDGIRFLSVHALVSRYARLFCKEHRAEDLLYRTVSVGERGFGLLTQPEGDGPKTSGDILVHGDVLFAFEADKPLIDPKVLAVFDRTNNLVFSKKITVPSKKMPLEKKPVFANGIEIDVLELYLSTSKGAGSRVFLYSDLFAFLDHDDFYSGCPPLFTGKKLLEKSIHFLGAVTAGTNSGEFEEEFDLFLRKAFSFSGLFELESEGAFPNKVQLALGLSFWEILAVFQLFVVKYQAELLLSLLDGPDLRFAVRELSISILGDIEDVYHQKKHEILQPLYQADPGSMEMYEGVKI